MAAFSYQHHSFLLDHPVFLPNTPIKMSSFSEEQNNNFSQIYLPESLHQIPLDFSFHESSCLENCTKLALSNNEVSVTNNKNTADSSSVVDKPENGEQVTQKVTSMDKKRKSRDGSPLNSALSKEAREVKGKKQKKCNGKPKADKKDQKKVPEAAPTDYIHVRARRGQATDSHSLAERVRREKISERMKLLQALLPGCDKVTGKALMLDEIINYVQSLQNQVEFLSMKLASVNPMFYDFGMDLDSFMVTPEVNTQRLNGLVSPLPNVQKCNPDQATAFSDTTTTFTTPNSYPLLISTPSVQFQQVPQGNGQLLWDVDEQRQKFINQSGFSSNLCSFH